MCSSDLEPTKFCIARGGGKRCQKEGCKSSAASPTEFCKAHGGGKRCESEACSVYDVKPYARYKGQDNKYLCWTCLHHLYPELASSKSFIRQEHLVLAEIQRIMDNELNAIMCTWDCPPNNCTLRRPDLLYELNNIYMLFEVDEYGHHHTTERILELRNALHMKPILMVRINPNLKERPLLKQRKISNGEIVWECTKHFENAFKELKKIILNKLDEFVEFYNDVLPAYKEIGFNFDPILAPTDRGDVTITQYGFII